MNISPHIFDEIIGRLLAAVPNNVHNTKADLAENFKSILQSMFTKLDLVSREEFDVQAKVLAKTRAKLDDLEQKISLLEKQTSSS